MDSVIIYSTPTCMYCKQAKEFFMEHNVPFKEVNVLADLEARARMMEKSGQKKVPVFELSGEIFVGFTESKEKLRERLQLPAAS